MESISWSTTHACSCHWILPRLWFQIKDIQTKDFTTRSVLILIKMTLAILKFQSLLIVCLLPSSIIHPSCEHWRSHFGNFQNLSKWLCFLFQCLLLCPWSPDSSRRSPRPYIVWAKLDLLTRSSHGHEMPWGTVGCLRKRFWGEKYCVGLC